MKPTQVNVGIFVYPNAEVLDFSGPFEVFSTASRITQDANIKFNVFIVAANSQPVVARGGFTVVPKYSFDTHPCIDVLIIPGGIHNKVMTDSAVVRWVAVNAARCSIAASVCTGVFILAAANVVCDHEVTTHWEDISELRHMFPELKVTEGVRWVDQGNIVTSAGISAGIDMSLHLVRRLTNDTHACLTAKQIDFDWVS